ncbi:MAG: amidohydrolase family protein [Pseudomonadota bacterium]
MSAMAEIPLCQAPDPTPRAPSFNVPSGACDTHAHIFPADAHHRFNPARSYTPPDASLEQFIALQNTLGMQTAVLTQPSVYGVDNTVIMDAVAAYPRRLKAVVAVGEDVSDGELTRLAAAGAVGTRVNVVDGGGMPFTDFEAVRRFTQRIAGLGWHLELLAHVHDFDDIRAALGNLPVPVVFGHLGYMPTRLGVDHPRFVAFLHELERGNTWVKLSGAYRISAEKAPPYTDVVPIAKALLSANPERVVWGSDWPHPKHEGVMPNDGYLLDQIVDWTDDPHLIENVLVHNPKTLYGF